MLRGTLDEITVITTGEAAAAVAAGDALDVRGWILPPHAPADIVIDGRHRYPLTVGDPRPDVVAAVRDPAAQLCGYRAVIPTSQLASGPHEVALVAREERGGEAVLASRSFEVHAARPSGDGEQVAGCVDYSVDEAGHAVAIEGATIGVRRDEVVTIRGWAADDVARVPARGAVALVGDHVVPAVYGYERSDVASVLGDEALRFCGFSASFPGSYLGERTTQFTLSLLAGDERGFVPTAVKLSLHAR